MTRDASSRAPLLVFSFGLLAIYAAAFVIVAHLGEIDRPDLTAGALTIDLTVIVPAIYSMLLVRRRGWPAVTVLPVFIGSVALAGVILPASRHHVLELVGYGAVLAELVLLGVVVQKSVRIRRSFRERVVAGFDLPAALREAARPVLGRFAGDALAYEIAVLHFALAGWGRRAAERPSSFTGHRECGYVSLAIAISIVAGVETVGVHFLVRMWSPATAWVLSGFGIYALVWLVGDLHAVRLRPTLISDTALHVRLGLRWSVDVPLAAIEGVADAAGVGLPRGTPGYLKAVLLGGPNRRLELSRPAVAIGPYGLMREVRTLDLRVDAPQRFDAALRQARERGPAEG